MFEYSKSLFSPIKRIKSCSNFSAGFNLIGKKCNKHPSPDKAMLVMIIGVCRRGKLFYCEDSQSYPNIKDKESWIPGYEILLVNQKASFLLPARMWAGARWLSGPHWGCIRGWWVYVRCPQGGWRCPKGAHKVPTRWVEVPQRCPKGAHFRVVYTCVPNYFSSKHNASYHWFSELEENIFARTREAHVKKRCQTDLACNATLVIFFPIRISSWQGYTKSGSPDTY